MDYAILNAKPAEDFLNPDNFKTSWDDLESHRVQRTAERQYQEGLAVSRKAEYVYITAMGTWGAHLKDGAHLTAYEGIGYHAHTASLLRGFLDGPAPLKIYRKDQEVKIIKERTGE